MGVLLGIIDIENNGKYVGGIGLNVDIPLALDIARDFNLTGKIYKEDYSHRCDGEINKLTSFLIKSGFGKTHHGILVFNQRYEIDMNPYDMDKDAFCFE